MLPVVAAFVVGTMLGPAARRLEALRVPRWLAALLLVASVTLIVAFVILLIFPRVSELTSGLPGIVGSLNDRRQDAVEIEEETGQLRLGREPLEQRSPRRHEL